MVGLAGAGSGGPRQRAGGCGAHRDDAVAVRNPPLGSGSCLDAPTSVAGSSHHCSGQPPLVCPRTVDRGSAVLGQLFRLPQSSAVHQRGQRSLAAVVVLWPGDAGGRDALCTTAATGSGAAASTADGAFAVVASVRRLLAAGGADAVHHGGYQTSQLLAPGDARGGVADRIRAAAPGSLVRSGLGSHSASHVDSGGWFLGFTPMDSSDQ